MRESSSGGREGGSSLGVLLMRSGDFPFYFEPEAGHTQTRRGRGRREGGREGVERHSEVEYRAPLPCLVTVIFVNLSMGQSSNSVVHGIICRGQRSVCRPPGH